MQCDSSNPYNSDDNRSHEKQSHQRKTPHRWKMNTSFFRIYHQLKSPAKSWSFNIPSHLPPARKWSIKDVVEIFYLLCSLYEEPGWPCKGFGKSMHRSLLLEPIFKRKWPATDLEKVSIAHHVRNIVHSDLLSWRESLSDEHLSHSKALPLVCDFLSCFPIFAQSRQTFWSHWVGESGDRRQRLSRSLKKIALQLLRIEMNMIWHVLDGQYSIRKRKDFVWTSFKIFWVEYLLFFVYLIFMIMYPIYGVAYFVH